MDRTVDLCFHRNGRFYGQCDGHHNYFDVQTDTFSDITSCL